MKDLLYLLFIGCFLLLVLFTIIQIQYNNSIEGLTTIKPDLSTTNYNRQYTIQQNAWDQYSDIIAKYETLLQKCQENYPIVWNIGRISSSHYITSPTISINQSSTFPNIYLDIVFPYPMDGLKGPPGSSGVQGSNGVAGEVGAMGERGIPCPYGNYNSPHS